jgi:hypothetical protein
MLVQNYSCVTCWKVGKKRSSYLAIAAPSFVDAESVPAGKIFLNFFFG